MSQSTFEEKYLLPEENEIDNLDLNLLTVQDLTEEYGADEFPNLKLLIESLKEGFSLSSFTINYALIINISIIASTIITIWLLTIIGGIFNDIIIIMGIVMIVLIMMMFESLSLIEKEIEQNTKKGDDIEENENNLSNA